MTTRRSTSSKTPTVATAATGIAGDPDTADGITDEDTDRTFRTSEPAQVPTTAPSRTTLPVSDPDPGDQPTTVPDPDELPVSNPIPLTQPATAPDRSLNDRLSTDDDGDGVQARVEVLVAHDQVLRGETGVVELTPRVRGLIDAGYLRLLGIERSGDGTQRADQAGEVRAGDRF